MFYRKVKQNQGESRSGCVFIEKKNSIDTTQKSQRYKKQETNKKQ